MGIFIAPIVSALVIIVVYGIADHVKRKRANERELYQFQRRVEEDVRRDRERQTREKERIAAARRRRQEEEEKKKRQQLERKALLEKQKELRAADPHTLFMEEQRRLMSASLRYDILRRDNFRCQICGATAADGYKLHVDHIIPVSRGGKTEPANLRTLCERCNLGKGAKME